MKPAGYDVVAIGEGGLRLSVSRGSRLERTDKLDVEIAGTELNVLAGLASLGWRSGWISALPESPLGRRVLHQVHSWGVEFASATWMTGTRVGTYFVEYGAAPRATQVHFDRANTAFTRLTVDDVDWDVIAQARVLHLTGLTVPLSSTVLEVLREALAHARRNGVTVSFDVNYRATLWSPEQAADVLRPFVEAADILFCRSEDAALLYQMGPAADVCVRQLDDMSSATQILVSCGSEGAYASLDGQVQHVSSLPVDVVDRLGAGDGLAAGFLHGWLANEVATAPRYATAMAALALSQVGEQVTTTRAELNAVMASPTLKLHR